MKWYAVQRIGRKKFSEALRGEDKRLIEPPNNRFASTIRHETRARRTGRRGEACTREREWKTVWDRFTVPLNETLWGYSI